MEHDRKENLQRIESLLSFLQSEISFFVDKFFEEFYDYDYDTKQTRPDEVIKQKYYVEQLEESLTRLMDMFKSIKKHNT